MEHTKLEDNKTVHFTVNYNLERVGIKTDGNLKPTLTLALH